MKGNSFCVAVVGAFAAILSFRFVTASSNFACWLEFLADLFQGEVFPYCCVAALLLVVYLLLYELNVLCIAIILMLLAFSALLLNF